MKDMRAACTLFILLCTFTSAARSAESDEILLTTQHDVYEDYLCLLAGRNPLDIDDFTGECSRRDVVEIILLQQALALGGLNLPVKFEPGNFSLRNRRLLEKGYLLVSVDTFWLTEAQQYQHYLYISEPMIRRGEYTAGVYTSPSNKKVLSSRSLQDVQQLSGVTSQHWTADWYTMQQLHLKELVDEPSWVSQVKLVNQQFVDFMLAPFHVDFAKNGVDLVVVPKIAVKLDDSRHYVVSKNHPMGKAALKAINLGIAKMRQTGRIHKAYADAGFFYAQEHGWQIINE